MIVGPAGLELGSEARQAARRVVIARSSNRAPIERALDVEEFPRLYIEYHELPVLVSLKRVVTGVRTYYWLWQQMLRSGAAARHAAIGFDVVHHLTFASHTMPSGLRHVDVPFVWGPVGGAKHVPKPLRRGIGRAGWVDFAARTLRLRTAAVSPFRRATARASVVLAQTPATVAALPAAVRGRAQILESIAVPDALFRRTSLPHDRDLQRHAASGNDAATSRPFRVVRLGGLVCFKGSISVSVRSLRQASEVMRPSTSPVTVLNEPGWRTSHGRSASSVASASRVLFPGTPRWSSYGEQTSCSTRAFVILRSPSSPKRWRQGLPIVCLDVGGPAEQVLATAGIKVQPQRRESTIAALASALRLLRGDSRLRRELTAGATKYPNAMYRWSARAERVNATYRDVESCRRSRSPLP